MSKANIDTSIILPILQKIPIFSELHEEYHRKIIESIVMMYYPKDYVLFNQGDQGDALYIIKSGKVQIFHPASDLSEHNKEIAVIGENGFFGEMSLVSKEARNASAKTLEESEIFLLSKSDFKKLLDTDLNLTERINAAVMIRTAENNQ